jgi:hypothetical protein
MIPVTRRMAHQDGSDAGDDRECAAPLREPNLAPNDGPSISAASISPSRAIGQLLAPVWLGLTEGFGTVGVI